jgi:3D (Asp-Asp-Asp) domain-containing protein
MAGTYYNAIIRINAQTGTSYTLAIADFNSDTITTMNNVSANTVTVPPSVFPIGAQLLVAQEGAGQTSFVAGVGVTLNAVGLKISAQYSAATLIQTANNVWNIYGTLTA